MGIGDWGLGIGPNPQSPSPINKYKLFNYIISKKYHILNFKNKCIVKLWKQIKKLNMTGEKFEKKYEDLNS